MGAIASEITSLTIVNSIVYSDADQRKHQSSASLAFVRGIHRRPGNSPHKWPVTRKMLPFDDVIMNSINCHWQTTLVQYVCTQHIDHLYTKMFPGAPLLTWINFNSSMISNYFYYKVWDEITCPFPNFNGCTVDVWDRFSNFIRHFTGHVITFPCWDSS